MSLFSVSAFSTPMFDEAISTSSISPTLFNVAENLNLSIGWIEKIHFQVHADDNEVY